MHISEWGKKLKVKVFVREGSRFDGQLLCFLADILANEVRCNSLKNITDICGLN